MHCSACLGTLGQACHIASEGSTEMKVFKLCLNGLEACVGFDNFFVDCTEVGNICSYSPLLRMGEGMAIGVVGRHRSHKNGLVPDWQGLNWGSTGEIWLGMEGTDNQGGGWSIVTCEHSDVSIVKELDPLGWLKDPISDGNDKVRVVLVLDVSFWRHVEVFFIVKDVIFKSPVKGQGP